MTPDTARDSFAQTLRAEWTKFRTVRGWLVALAVAALVMVLVGLLSAAGSHRQVHAVTPPGEAPRPVVQPTIPTGPGGEAVNDAFEFVHQSLTGDGTVTVRVSELAGAILDPDGSVPAEVQPWAKAGVIVKDGTAEGSQYAAIMLTGGHGVRMQHNFTHDTAGNPSLATPRWLRLTRAGNRITGLESTDGQHWTTVGTVRLAGLPQTVQIGLFTTSPEKQLINQRLGGSEVVSSPTSVTATFDNLSLQGTGSGTWAADQIGDRRGDAQVTADGAVITASGDIAPDVSGFALTRERTLVGAFAALAVVIVLAALFLTSEYRRGLIRTTFAATPHRGRVLAAKAIVIFAVTFVAGLVAGAVALPVGAKMLRDNNNLLFPISWVTELRLVAGTAALLAVTAVFALAVAALLRRSVATVVVVIGLTVLPYILASASVLPADAGRWLLRLLPAAAFAIQQTLPAYHQVDGVYTVASGFFPLSPWAGFAVLCGYTAVALALATYRLRRRDA